MVVGTTETMGITEESHVVQTYRDSKTRQVLTETGGKFRVAQDRMEKD